ncbi:MAG TPA: polyphosphate polymerase domain-containing protein [Myxococcaceae bacterium]|nr:polyphosphate polymerase domain-containing protein [Myxococcaceae bacterium]
MIKRFNRFELKYIVTASLRDALLPEIRERMASDPESTEGGVYRVTSLYYDTPDLAFFRAKLDGIKFRRKLRVRIYGEQAQAPETPAMVEIKQRINRTVQKRRIALSLSEAYALCAGARGEDLADERDAEVAGEVEFLVRSLNLSPTCVISYVRHAFMGSAYEPGLRVTFDAGLRCGGPEGGLNPTDLFHFLPPDRCVMEVKANEAIPLWIVRLLARHSVSVQRYSKYCAGLAVLRAQRSRREHG